MQVQCTFQRSVGLSPPRFTHSYLSSPYKNKRSLLVCSTVKRSNIFAWEVTGPTTMHDTLKLHKEYWKLNGEHFRRTIHFFLHVSSGTRLRFCRWKFKELYIPKSTINLSCTVCIHFPWDCQLSNVWAKSLERWKGFKSGLGMEKTYLRTAVAYSIFFPTPFEIIICSMPLHKSLFSTSLALANTHQMLWLWRKWSTRHWLVALFNSLWLIARYSLKYYNTGDFVPSHALISFSIIFFHIYVFNLHVVWSKLLQ